MGKKYFNKNKMQTAKLQSKISTQLMRKDGQRHKKKSFCGEEKKSKFAAWQWQKKKYTQETVGKLQLTDVFMNY